MRWKILSILFVSFVSFVLFGCVFNLITGGTVTIESPAGDKRATSDCKAIGCQALRPEVENDED